MAVKPDRIESKIVFELRRIEALWQKTYRLHLLHFCYIRRLRQRAISL